MILFGYFCIFISISHVASQFCEITERVEEPYTFLEQTIKEIKFKNCTIDQELDPNINCDGSRLQTVSQNVTKYQLIEKISKICCEGYTKQNDDCIPICEKNCVNGDCIAPNTCKCSDGFQLQDQSINICIPICNPKCENGYCVQPNICQCSSGYSNSIKFNYICEPFCSEACINGFCAKPGKCECLEGFNSNNGYQNNCSKNCLPECQNGVCDNGECICNSGFKLTAHLINNCLPFCEEDCVNGICLGNNMCGCKDGYTLLNKTECYPDCFKNCENGTCIAPNLCKCSDGFTLSPDNGSCVVYENETEFLLMLRNLNRLTYFYIGLGVVILLLLLVNYCLICCFCKKSKGSDVESKKLSSDF